jgi:hypothetical protein
MAFGDYAQDKALQDTWNDFCDQLKVAGAQVFKDTSPANALQRADGFRFMTQTLSQAFDLSLETKDTKYPMIHPFCSWNRKLGGDNADCVYLQAWIDGQSTYKITGKKGNARMINFTVQGPRPETDGYYHTKNRNLHEPFGDVPEANMFGHQLVCDWEDNFVLYIGGPKRGPNWLPTTPGTRKLFLRQYFDSWDEQAAEYRIERLDMEGPRPVPTPDTIMEAVRWARDYMTGAMRDWPDWNILVGAGVDEAHINRFPRKGESNAQGDTGRGRQTECMRWRMAKDEAMIIEFPNYDAFYTFTNMGVFWNSMDFPYRPISYTPSRTKVDSDGRVRLIMTHEDPGYHNWLDTQGYLEGYLLYRNVMAPTHPDLETKIIKAHDIAKHVPKDCAKVTPEERIRLMHVRFNAIRRRYRI